MSLYNMLFGVNPAAGLFLAMLGTEAGKVPRFRDCYLDGEHIVIHTRTGGGNRDYYDSRSSRKEYDETADLAGTYNEDLRTLPGYVRDEDDDFDCTYASFYFRIPEQFAEAVEALRSGSERDPAQAWQDLFARLNNGDTSDPRVQHALGVVAPFIEKLKDVLNKRPAPGAHKGQDA